MKKYKTLFFDFDDTLFDFPESEKIALDIAFKKYGIPNDDETIEMYRKENRAFWREFEKGKYKDSQNAYLRFENLFKKKGIEGKDSKAVNECYLNALSTTAFPIENSVEMIKDLSEHFDIYIITNALKRVSDKRTAICGIEPYIKGRFVSEAVGVSKPSKKFFIHCLNASGSDAESTLVIGDSLSSDIMGGMNSGLDTCWFNRHGKKTKMPVTFEVHSISEMHELLKGLSVK